MTEGSELVLRCLAADFPDGTTAWAIREIDSLRQQIGFLKDRLAKKTDAHDRDGYALIKLNTEVDRLRAELASKTDALRVRDAQLDEVRGLLAAAKAEPPHPAAIVMLHISGLEQSIKAFEDEDDAFEVHETLGKNAKLWFVRDWTYHPKKGDRHDVQRTPG